MQTQSFGAQAFRQERAARENRHAYSITRALKCAVDGREPDGWEGECHQEIVRHSGPPRTTALSTFPPASLSVA